MLSAVLFFVCLLLSFLSVVFLVKAAIGHAQEYPFWVPAAACLAWSVFYYLR